MHWYQFWLLVGFMYDGHIQHFLLNGSLNPRAVSRARTPVRLAGVAAVLSAAWHFIPSLVG